MERAQVGEKGLGEEDETILDISAYSKMTKPEPPKPHKHQIHVLIIGLPSFFSLLM